MSSRLSGSRVEADQARSTGGERMLIRKRTTPIGMTLAIDLFMDLIVAS